MKVLPIVVGAVALIAGTPVAHASPPPGCATDVLSVPGCQPEFPGCEAVAEFTDDPSAFSAEEDCDPGEAVPSGDVWYGRSDATPPEDAASTEPPDAPPNPYGPARSTPLRPGAIGDQPHRIRAPGTRGVLPGTTPGTTPGATPSRPGGDPTSIVQRPYAAVGTERDSVDNSGCGAMRGGPPDRPRSAGPPSALAPGVSADSRRGPDVSPPRGRRPELPQIVPGPSASAPAGAKLTTLAPTGPLRAGRRSWAAMVGAAIVGEAGLLWLAVGLALRRRGRSRSKR